MFLDGKGNKSGSWEDPQYQEDARNLSKFIIAAFKTVQNARPPQMFEGRVTVRCILAGTAFSVGVLIHQLPRREVKYLREYFIHKLDQMLDEHRTAD